MVVVPVVVVVMVDIAAVTEFQLKTFPPPLLQIVILVVVVTTWKR